MLVRPRTRKQLDQDGPPPVEELSKIRSRIARPSEGPIDSAQILNEPILPAIDHTVNVLAFSWAAEHAHCVATEDSMLHTEGVESIAKGDRGIAQGRIGRHAERRTRRRERCHGCSVLQKMDEETQPGIDQSCTLMI